MPADEINVSPRELMIVMNYLHSRSIYEFQIKVPWIARSALFVRLDADNATAHVRKLVEDRTIKKAHKMFDNPILTICLLMAGIVHPSNWDAVFSELTTIARRDATKGERPALITFDTVALIRRYYSVLNMELETAQLQGQLKGWGIKYLVVSGVVSELTKYDSKYRPSGLEKLSHKFNYWCDFMKFNNQLETKDRMFRMGAVEVKKMINSGTAVKVQSEQKDENIINAISDYSCQQQVDVLAISEDSDFISRCADLGITSFRFDIPKISSNWVTTSWRNVCQLLYATAVLMGAIRLEWENDHLDIYGIWLGKKDEHWNSENVQLVISDKDLAFSTRLLVNVNRGLNKSPF